MRERLKVAGTSRSRLRWPTAVPAALTSGWVGGAVALVFNSFQSISADSLFAHSTSSNNKRLATSRRISFSHLLVVKLSEIHESILPALVLVTGTIIVGSPTHRCRRPSTLTTGQKIFSFFHPISSVYCNIRARSRWPVQVRTFCRHLL